MDRRVALRSIGMLAALFAIPRTSQATTARAISLPDLVGRSNRIARATPLEGFAHFEDVGDTRHIVTYTRLRVDDLIRGSLEGSEILVRTLGGRVAKVSEIVHGEAVLAVNEACVVFLQTNPEGIDQVTAMAQGHYPLSTDASGAVRLGPSRNMPQLLGDARAAVVRLSGLQVREARDLIIGEGR
jgi:hypothetical protein